MTFNEWKNRYVQLSSDVIEAQGHLELAESKLNEFFKTTVGFEERGMATLLGTIQMIETVIEMKKADEQRPSSPQET